MSDFTPYLRKSVEIIYQDHDLLALNKPDGLLSESVFKAPYDTPSESFLLPDGVTKIYLLHRLDRDTSGLLLTALNPKLASQMKALFKNHQIQKTYTALLSGVVTPPTGTFKDRLERSPIMNAVSKYHVKQIFKHLPASLVQIQPETGRTNQLRLQTSSRHWPILGDRKFGNFGHNKMMAEKHGLKRMFLHAEEIEFIHPSTQKKIRLNSPLPLELQACLDLINAGD